MNSNNRSIAIFCSASELSKKYIKEAEEFASLMVERGYDLVWGGSDRGLMKTVASVVQEKGGKITGVTIDVFKNVARENADEMIIAQTLGERKGTMLDLSDAVVVFAGGIGTLDELAEVLELKKQGQHNKPVVVLNTDNFYKGLVMQLQRMQEEGLIHKSVNELIYFTESSREAMNFIQKNMN
jgi:uncharacterized protein (TIGR00730 family)